VAHFHLGNGARLERINWLGNTAPRGFQEWGPDVNRRAELLIYQAMEVSILGAYLQVGASRPSARTPAWLHSEPPYISIREHRLKAVLV
jgi:hypothetical protein